jgi:hypothetical protein
MTRRIDYNYKNVPPSYAVLLFLSTQSHRYTGLPNVDSAFCSDIIEITTYTVRKMGLILRSIERMLKMKSSIARKFTLQLLRRYDVKPPSLPKKPHKRNLPA